VPRVGHVKDNPKRGEKESDIRMDTKKIMAIFAILMIALGVAGFAYAHWEKYLWLNATVKTGKFDLDWSFSYTVSPENHKIIKGATGETIKEFDVATISYAFVEEDNDGNKELLNITIDNAYPCLWINGTIDVTNTGTIPAKLYYYTMNYDQWLGQVLYSYKIRGDLNQIDPGQSVYLDFEIHFPESTPQNVTGNFALRLWFCNWNESPQAL
jgi:hypothetical protein